MIVKFHRSLSFVAQCRLKLLNESFTSIINEYFNNTARFYRPPCMYRSQAEASCHWGTRGTCYPPPQTVWRLWLVVYRAELKVSLCA